MNFRNLFLFTILLIGVHPLHLPFGGLSLFQLSVLLLGIVSFFKMMKQRSFPSGQYVSFSIIFLTSGFVAYSESLSPTAFSNLLLTIMGSMCFLIVPVFFNRADTKVIVKTLVRSQYIAIPLGALMWFVFYNLGFFMERIDLIGGMYFEFDEEAMDRSLAGTSNIRLSLPYPTPPVLSVAMAMTIIMLYYVKNLFKPIIRYILIILFCLVMIGTGSRTGIIGIVLFSILRMISLKKIKLDFRWIILLIIALITFIWAVSEIPYLETLLSRFTEMKDDDMSEDRHLLVPLDGVLIWLSSPLYFLFGIGYGSSLYMKGIHTFMAPSFLNSYVTLIAERGIMGLILSYQLISLGIKLYRREKFLTDEERGLTFALVTGLLCSLFYETMGCYYFLFIIACAFMLERSTRCKKEMISYD